MTQSSFSFANITNLQDKVTELPFSIDISFVSLINYYEIRETVSGGH